MPWLAPLWADARRLEREVPAPFVRRGRVFAPAYAQGEEAGHVMRRRAAAGGPPVAAMRNSLVDDSHLALACRAHGVRLLTRNVGDFARVVALVPGVALDSPWPTGQRTLLTGADRRRASDARPLNVWWWQERVPVDSVESRPGQVTSRPRGATPTRVE